MKNIRYWFVILIFILGCTTTAKRNENALESLKQMTMQDIQLNEYIIGAGDIIQIQVWRHPDLNSTIKVQNNGMVSFPLVGTMKVSGMALAEFQDTIIEKFDKYIVDPQVSIQIKTPSSQKIYVLGEVKKPGIYLLENLTTVTEAIGLAGGFNHDAKKSEVLLLRPQERGKLEPMALNIKDIMRGKGLDQNIYIHKGDIIYVPLSTVARMDRFFDHLSKALTPFAIFEQLVINYPAFEDVITGDYDKDENGQPILVISP